MCNIMNTIAPLHFHLAMSDTLNVQGSSHSEWMKPKCVTIQMKAIKQYFHAVLFIMLYKAVLTFISVDETLVCDHSNESY